MEIEKGDISILKIMWMTKEKNEGLKDDLKKTFW